MFEEEIQTLLEEDVNCNLFEVDGSTSPNEVPNKLSTELPELGIFMGVTKLRINPK
jgi:hypothetical protein